MPLAPVVIHAVDHLDIMSASDLRDQPVFNTGDKELVKLDKDEPRSILTKDFRIEQFLFPSFAVSDEPARRFAPKAKQILARDTPDDVNTFTDFVKLRHARAQFACGSAEIRRDDSDSW